MRRAGILVIGVLVWPSLTTAAFIPENQRSTADARAAAPGDVRLPDGSLFTFWEKPLRFSKTYYVDGSSPRSDDAGPGTLDQPFRSISKAADVLQPGERVVIAEGIYREVVRPARGGTGADTMISYEAAEGAKVIVRGSAILKDGWRLSGGQGRGGGGGGRAGGAQGGAGGAQAQGRAGGAQGQAQTWDVASTAAGSAATTRSAR